MDVNQIYYGGHLAIHIYTESSLCCTPERNIMLRPLHFNKNKKKDFVSKYPEKFTEYSLIIYIYMWVCFTDKNKQFC